MLAERESRSDDLGKTGKQMQRSEEEKLAYEEAMRTRVFGVPSTRADIRPPKVRSLADHKNYGNEPDAKRLLSPFVYAELGLSEDDFVLPRAKEDLHDVAVAAWQLSEEDFNRCFDLALANCPEGSAGVSYAALREAVAVMEAQSQ